MWTWLGRLIPVLSLGISISIGGDARGNSLRFPVPIEEYGAAEAVFPGQKTAAERILLRARSEPLNVAVTCLFLAAIVHTFLAGAIARRGHNLFSRGKNLSRGFRRLGSLVAARLCHLLGEMELTFLVWAIPSAGILIARRGWENFRDYLGGISFAEPIFIFSAVAIAATRPVLELAEKVLGYFAGLGKGTPLAWWLSILIVAPPLGSLITEPAAITIAAMLLSKKFYSFRPSPPLAYATVGLLFTCISVGGALTHFAAPPILMVAHRWHWTTPHVFLHLGLRALLGILIATGAYALLFRRELVQLSQKSFLGPAKDNAAAPVPPWISAVHLLSIGWMVIHLHSPVTVAISMAAFCLFVRLTARHQAPLRLRESFFVGAFLAGLVFHGGLQQWWIEPLLGGLGPLSLFSMGTFLSSFNDNAAVTYLTTLVPGFLANGQLQHAIVAGAIAGGGLTVIANAPNPAGQSLLRPHFPGGISPLRLFLAALLPTAIMVLLLMP
ncbi:MAG: putative Na+/H+ antiporter [Puniceicoccales bacterium]|jgi:hypothetical protein|nr:putative Na+/H+ antiporter [Puniceicoccales bacterium]